MLLSLSCPLREFWFYQGALLRGVQSFNERMLSHWRAEGFVDLTMPLPTAMSIPASRISGAQSRGASAMLRKLLLIPDPNQALLGASSAASTAWVDQKESIEGKEDNRHVVVDKQRRQYRVR